ncbi:zinc finger and BTB domain-containing protein 20 isoform X1 [Brienomyrus brachyistius]|uniref:zinc finger and BTB domain-containing protein 20 isoform X1 n=2 Tax=Brienomyrus brachyistius TaxID=42636 RepID=UPI0020B29B9F|nr:zinc finger and BTB domain-containing protein 20 isoform X1 [Brienomyrus brachyistius]
MMNGSLYISFFQGQLESTMEQVVQLAVQEITKTVGANLNSLLLETTAKDQENQRLRLRLQSSKFDSGEAGNACAHGEGMEEDPTSEDIKIPVHAANLSSQLAMHISSYRLEQRGQAVDQLKAVMEQVLKFAVLELTKIVEASFDDLLLELVKKEKESKILKQSLVEGDQISRQDCNIDLKSPENRSRCPSSSDKGDQDKESSQDPPSSKNCGANVEHSEKPMSVETVTGKQTVLSVAQDWVPILDKVFGQKWCSDLWQNKELEGVEHVVASKTGATSIASPDGVIPEKKDALFTSPQETTSGSSFMYVHPSVGGDHSPCPSGDDLQLKSPSILHRLLTIPSQGLNELLCSNHDIPVEPLPMSSGASPDTHEHQREPQVLNADQLLPPGEEEADEKEFVEAKAPVGRKNYTCKQCGRKFSRQPLLKVHQQTHSTSSLVRCSLCGKRFSHPERLQAHLRTHNTTRT